VLILVLYVDDTRCAGERKEVEMVLQEDRRENQDSEIRKIKEAHRHHI
jgi:hypothetical protein